ncbi:MAG TPA: glycine oxidase ThiO [Chloroflexota bacterium]|nr:glycine oxidase ThiO [Chloroflexota bacterium]
MTGLPRPGGAIPDVLVVGGGVIGCAVAYAAASAGLRVTLIEGDRLGAGASGAAAGLLAPQVEAHQPDDFFAFCLAGRIEHTRLAPRLLEEAGLDVEFRQTGILRLALEEREAVDLRGRAIWQRDQGLTAEWLDPEQVGQREPAFAGAAGRRLVGALWLPEEGQVRSPRLVQALAIAAIRRGATFREGLPAVALQCAGDRIVAVQTPAGPLPAGAVVLAAGAWSGALATTIGIHLPVEPIKGQIVALGSLMRAPQHILWSGECYVAPKADGQIIVGATEERAGFDRRPTLSGLLQLALGATNLLPELGRLTVETQWGGLRPAVPDRLPVIGWAPGYRNLMLATAHYRNGVLLGPLTGNLVTEMLLQREPGWELRPYRPQRLTAGGSGVVT